MLVAFANVLHGGEPERESCLEVDWQDERTEGTGRHVWGASSAVSHGGSADGPGGLGLVPAIGDER